MHSFSDKINIGVHLLRCTEMQFIQNFFMSNNSILLNRILQKINIRLSYKNNNCIQWWKIILFDNNKQNLRDF
jgi:hypothetical protein